MFSRPFRFLRGGRSRPLVRFSLIASAALLGVPASTAQAALVSGGGGGCTTTPLSEPFARWGDTSSYALVAQGDFEGSLSQWTLGGDAVPVSGSEPYAATGTLGSHSLALANGASAQSPAMCVDASDPTFRFFARGDTPLATLAVAVVYRTALGPLALALGVIAPDDTWEPTPALPTASALAGLLSGGTAQLALRFTALTGTTDIDDVFVDPRMR